ncbi:unnamed protein product [Paramecium octaurelia]|uniref:RBR-type E3 ubiquitin transferase n=1 Tax=Paramecium octaurelia TaxID=43137 RepID=A0A8S1W0Y1_PAROT|nr:unnamed protein product [Paramecium octaurelia]
MFNCIICTQTTNFKTKCRCHFCLLCLLNWFEEKNKSKQIDIINCPNQDCSDTYNRNEILSYCHNQPYERIFQEILFKQYLKNDDIRPCPSGQCKSYGFIELDKVCDEELECLECGFKWRDFNKAPFTFKQEYIIKNIFGILRQFGYCLVTANQCPICGILIQRTGGCRHMTCKACSNQFCWNCKQEWKKHQESQCSCQYLITSGLYLTLIINIFYQLGILNYLLYVFNLLFWMFEILIIQVIIIGTVAGIIFFFKSIFDLKSRKRPIRSVLKELGGSTILLMIEYLVIWFSTVFFQITLHKAFIGFLLEFLVCIYMIGFNAKVKLGYKCIFSIIMGLCLVGVFGLNGLAILIWLLQYIIPVEYIHTQINFNAIALGVLILLNISNLLELLCSKLAYLLLGSTILNYKKGNKDNYFALLSILAISYVYDIL